MKTKYHSNDIVEIIDNNILIKEIDDVFSLLFAHNSTAIIIRKENITDSFFDLSTGFAGDILQKFSNYNVRLAIIGDYSSVKSKALNDFIRESNRRRDILFVSSVEEAVIIFSK